MICPRIDPGEDERKSVKKEYEHISREIFPEFKAAMLHGKQTAREKEKTLDDFRAGKINILVATSVIEVGIDVPNATIMIVEGAESFGLAQLHQLRGRIGRGEHQSYFYAISESSNATTAKRLRALRDAKNGFELAEYDLQLRGPGELTGKNQWGLSDIGMEALKNIKKKKREGGAGGGGRTRRFSKKIEPSKTIRSSKQQSSSFPKASIILSN